MTNRLVDQPHRHTKLAYTLLGMLHGTHGDTAGELRLRRTALVPAFPLGYSSATLSSWSRNAHNRQGENYLNPLP